MYKYAIVIEDEDGRAFGRLAEVPEEIDFVKHIFDVWDTSEQAARKVVGVGKTDKIRSLKVTRVKEQT